MKTFKNLFLLITVFVLGIISTQAQTTEEDNLLAIKRHRQAAKNVLEIAKEFEAKTYANNNNETLVYRLLKPLNYDSNKKYPLVVCLSGSGGRGTDNIKQISGCWPSQILSKPENRENYPCFLFVPQCPPNLNWGISSNINQIESLVFDVIKNIEDEYSVDVDRLYVTGQSMGGFGTWHYILTHPKMFAAAIPICGRGNPELAHKIVDVPIWAFHGAEDSAVSVDYSRRMIKSIKKLGGRPLYTEFENVGHISWPLAYDTPGLLEWLFKQKLDRK
ncbi:dienelactone hydrolase family protein [Flavivirga abyssicola]|uniref:carboxylesterase family protein n=1 Tax=Flavivirga abyssicola TaxID=3063533 RepID=UPI0026DEB030|nr:dienelactone hydrolase family protein [Flavivirga sp. MEBiC07777]WVK12293.1 dienelactone hydrolase family protein [Flavivirga sp. MEBiC07777]